jgi:Carboxypeptidase regulatory-like domain
VRHFATAAAVVLLCAAASAGAFAAATEVVVVVVDDMTSRPLAHARVTLLGTGPGEARTDRSDVRGAVRLNGFAPGAVRVIVEADGYPKAESRFDVVEDTGGTVNVVVRLTRLKTIGRTSAVVTSGSQRIGEATPLRRISSDLVDALSRLGGVAVSGDGSAFSIALGGRDPSQTSYTLDGTPVGVNAGQLAIDSDLLQDAQVNAAQDTVAFALLSPTKDPVMKLESTVGGYGASSVKSTFQGATGQLGYAVAHAERGADSILDGRTYTDLSGERYRHVGETVRVGDYVKIAAPIGYWSASIADAVSRSAGNPLPAYLAGDIPAGIGPGEHRSSNAENWIAVANGTVHGYALSINASSWSYRVDDDQRSRVLALTPSPLYLSDATTGQSVQGYLSATAGDRRTIELLGTLTWGRASSAFTTPSTATQSATSSVERSLKATERWKLDEGRSLLASAAVANDGVATLPTFHLEERMRRGNAVRNFAVDYGRKPVRAESPENIRALLDPGAASYDCQGRLVTAQVPGDLSAQPSRFEVSGSLATRSSRAHAQISGYWEVQRDLLLTGASVEATGDNTAGLGNFIDQLRAGFGPLGGCAVSTAPVEVAFIKSVGHVSARYAGVDIAGGVSVSPRVQIEGDIAVQRAAPAALPSSLVTSRSYYVVGRQLPNVPFWNGTFTVDWQSRDERTEALINATFVSVNNKNNLPARTTYSLALQRSIAPNVSLLAVGTNVFGTYTGDFVSARYAVPYLLANGRLQPALAAPQAPKRLFLTAIYRNR